MSFVHAPNVECALGKHVMVQNAMRIGFESAVAERVKELGASGFTSGDEMAEWTAKMHLLSGGKTPLSGCQTEPEHHCIGPASWCAGPQKKLFII